MKAVSSKEVTDVLSIEVLFIVNGLPHLIMKSLTVQDPPEERVND